MDWKMGKHFPVREFWTDWKSQAIFPQNTGIVRDLSPKYWKSEGRIFQPVAIFLKSKDVLAYLRFSNQAAQIGYQCSPFT